MTLEPQALAPKRKSPTQSRSKATVAALVEATAQILERQGEDAVTTKTVAARAGVSIGTLYQYFDDRDALLLAVADVERQRFAERLRTFTAERRGDALLDFVRMLLRSFVRRRGARRQFELMTAMMGKQGAADRTFADIVAANLREGHPDAAPAVIEANAFAMTYALQGALRAAALLHTSMLKEPAFEDALCLIVRALVPRPSEPRAMDTLPGKGAAIDTILILSSAPR